MELGTGTTISFSSSFFAEVLDISPPGASRESIDTSHMETSSGAKTFTPADLVDWGEMSVEMAFEPSTTPPINSEAESITITFGGGSGASTWSFSGFMTGFEPSVPLEDKMTATATIKVSGRVTVA